MLLLEKTGRIGTKILISGGGKCNVAHAGPLEAVLGAFRPNEARFIRPACYRLTNEEIVRLLTDRGLRVYTRPDGRVFPVDQTAKDVVAILTGYLREAGVEVRLDSPVAKILAEDGRVKGVRVDVPRDSAPEISASRFGAKALLAQVLSESGEGRRIRRGDPYDVACPTVVLACGGSSYPKSGTTGDGWRWAEELGHTVVKPRAALAPIDLRNHDASLAGVAVRKAALKARAGGKEFAKTAGDLLFTHHGVSGPAVLAISRVVAERLESAEVSLEIDFWPSIPNDQVDEVVFARLARNPRRTVRAMLEDEVPGRLARAICERIEIPDALTCARLDRRSRSRLAQNLIGFPIGRVQRVPLEKGEVVAGGVSLEEVDPKSMRSRRVEGLYLCGEVLDIAGPVGGYNLQAAFATGYLAGESAARALSS